MDDMKLIEGVGNRLDLAIKNNDSSEVKKIISQYYPVILLDKLKKAYGYLKENGLNYKDLDTNLTKLKGGEARRVLKECCVG